MDWNGIDDLKHGMEIVQKILQNLERFCSVP